MPSRAPSATPSPSTRGVTAGVQLLSCEPGAPRGRPAPPSRLRLPGKRRPARPGAPPPLLAPAGSVPGAMPPGGSPRGIPAGAAAAMGAVNQRGAAPPPRSPLAAAPLTPLIGAAAAARPYIRRRSARPAPSEAGERRSRSRSRAARRALRDALPPPRGRRAAPLARE